MKVALLIPTYARFSFLQEALYCALAQDYRLAGILILNDCPEQKITCNIPNVSIFNYNQEPFDTLGEKRNTFLDIAYELGADRICWLDDDDLCKPNYVSGLMKASRGNPCVGDRAWSYYKQDDMPQPEWKETLWPNEMLINPASWRNTPLYPSIDSGEDQIGRAKIENLPDCAHSLNRAYIYRWGQGSFHVSGAGDPLGGNGFRADAQRRMRESLEPTGTLNLTPKLHHDYGF